MNCFSCEIKHKDAQPTSVGYIPNKKIKNTKFYIKDVLQ